MEIVYPSEHVLTDGVVLVPDAELGDTRDIHRFDEVLGRKPWDLSVLIFDFTGEVSSDLLSDAFQPALRDQPICLV